MWSFVHQAPATRVVFGAGRRIELAAEVARLGGGAGGRPVLFANTARESGREAHAQLASDLVGLIESLPMHVPLAAAEEARKVVTVARADCLVAVGGGSAIGLAKAVAADLGLPIVAVPTTYSGSEMTNIWGCTDDTGKHTQRDPRVLPKTVIYDPDLMSSLPPELAAASGINALAHAVEALYAPGLSPLAELTAREAVRALGAGLPRLADCTELTYGAWLAGWSLGNTAMGVHHKLAHVLGGSFGLPHAQTHSALLPYVVAANAESAPRAMAQVGAALTDAGLEVDHAAGAIWDLRAVAGASVTLAELGLGESALSEAVRLVLASGVVNPRPLAEAWLVDVLQQAWIGDRPVA